MTVDGGSFHNPATLEANLERCERDLAELERELREPGSRLDSEAWRHADRLRSQIVATREALSALAAEVEGVRGAWDETNPSTTTSASPARQQHRGSGAEDVHEQIRRLASELR